MSALIPPHSRDAPDTYPLSSYELSLTRAFTPYSSPQASQWATYASNNPCVVIDSPPTASWPASFLATKVLLLVIAASFMLAYSWATEITWFLLLSFNFFSSYVFFSSVFLSCLPNKPKLERLLKFGYTFHHLLSITRKFNVKIVKMVVIILRVKQTLILYEVDSDCTLENTIKNIFL